MSLSFLADGGYLYQLSIMGLILIFGINFIAVIFKQCVTARSREGEDAFLQHSSLQLDYMGLPTLPLYLSQTLSYGLQYRIGQLRVSSHQLAIEMGRYTDTPRPQRICQLCSMQEVEDESHFIFRCPIYYEIRGRYYCLYRDTPLSLGSFLAYPDTRCVGPY
ncbi:hypothetical protein O6H91_Y088500 [Diphasiastrum complanatum]|nr:hypothetical protein O6H91_Y088500 [Diphasiastrum complanatum]